MMKTLKITAFAAILIVALIIIAPTSKTASNDNHRANLTGYEEVPAVSSTGNGRFRAKIEEDDQEIEYELNYEDLEGTTTTAAHIHLGQRSVNGGVIAFICGGGGKPPCTATSGSFSGTFTAADVVGPTPQGIAPGEFAEVVRALRAGRIYVNVHTNKHPGGEIRGQIR